MSTKKIREALESYRALVGRQPVGAAPWEAVDYDDALAEVEAIEKAAVALHRCNPTPYAGNSEKGRLYYPAMKVIHAIAEEQAP